MQSWKLRAENELETVQERRKTLRDLFFFYVYSESDTEKDDDE